MSDCIFCKIASGEIPSNKVYEDDKIIAFHDLSPISPVHVLIVPKVHVESIRDISEDNVDYVSHLMLKVSDIARTLGVDESGFRLVTNSGKDGGQTVGHLHFHLGGGRTFNWPPG